MRGFRQDFFEIKALSSKFLFACDLSLPPFKKKCLVANEEQCDGVSLQMTRMLIFNDYSFLPS